MELLWLVSIHGSSLLGSQLKKEFVEKKSNFVEWGLQHKKQAKTLHWMKLLPFEFFSLFDDFEKQYH